MYVRISKNAFEKLVRMAEDAVQTKSQVIEKLIRSTIE